jgi:hypothetical protein
MAVAGTFTASLAPAGEAAMDASALFTKQEHATLDAVADTLVPGAVRAGVTAFVAAMLAEPDPLLCYSLLSFPMAPAKFYRASLAAFDDLSRKAFAMTPDALTPADRAHLIARLLAPGTVDWTGPPASLVYFVIRNDAIDAVYGAEAAYTHLGVPYMAHIAPPARW